MRKNLLILIACTGILSGCAASYSGYESKCACNFEEFNNIPEIA